MTLAGSPAEALNLTPLRLIISNDGPARVRNLFQDTDSRWIFRIDPKMQVSGSNDAAIFRFDDVRTAVARLAKSRTPAGLAFDEKGLPAYEALAKESLPAEASDVELVEQTPDAIAINGWKSMQFVYSYHYYGLSYRRTITFLNINPTVQLVFDVSARQTDFDRVFARSYHVINSLNQTTNESAPGAT